MKSYFIDINWSRTTRDNFFTCASYISDQAKADPIVSSECANFVSRLSECLAILDEAMVRTRKAEQSDTITACDVRRMSLYRMFKRLVRTMMESFDLQVQAAAKRLNQVLIDNRFKENGNMDRITSALLNLLQDLQGKCAADVATVSGTEIVTEMAQANNTVYQLVMERNAYWSERPNKEVEMAREDTEAALDDLLRAVESRAYLGELERYQQFINFVNEYIIRVKRLALRTPTKGLEATPNQPLGPNGPTLDDEPGGTTPPNEETPGDEEGGGNDNQQPGGGTTDPPSGPNTDAWGDGDEGDGSDV